MIIAFAQTTPALLAGAKTVTRRQWSDRHHAQMVARVGEIVDAWSAGPHRGGKPVAKIRLLSVTRERTADIPDSDWDAEGFAYMEERGILLGGEVACADLWRRWREASDLVTSVVRFELVEVLPPASEDCEVQL